MNTSFKSFGHGDLAVDVSRGTLLAPKPATCPLIVHRGMAHPRWTCEAAVPLNWDLSKNKAHVVGTSPRGRRIVYTPKHVATARMGLTRALCLALKHYGGDVLREKLWIDLFIEFEDHRGDVGNFWDAVADCAEKATGLNDRWVVCQKMDFCINRNGPNRIIVRMLQ